jgi:aconitate hydratase
MRVNNLDSLKTKNKLRVAGKEYNYFDLPTAAAAMNFNLANMPCSMKILLENLLRYEDGVNVKVNDIKAVATWLEQGHFPHEIAFMPSRVLLQDFTAVPLVVDLAAMRNAAATLNADPNLINPMIPVDLVIDHSVQVDKYGTDDAYEANVSMEIKRNLERYQFLRWGQKAFKNFKIVPPGTGICHQVNLEYLAKVVWINQDHGELNAYPDTILGTDSHTTMVNGLSVLGWGVGGIEAEAAMLGQATSMMLPEVIGFKLIGALSEGVTATDLVLTITQMLREKGVVGKFVEYFGDGLDNINVADRATISNMAPEYGATCGFFPTDEATLQYLKLSGRSDEEIALVESYTKTQGLWRNSNDIIKFTDIIELNLSTVETSLAGPKRPQDRIVLRNVGSNFNQVLPELNTNVENIGKVFPVKEANYNLENGSIVIAAITSCTNTSNPSVMIAAGLLARKARKLGLTSRPWVKTSLAPGSKVVSEYYKNSGLKEDLDALGFNLVGYGCTTCIGNSGPLDPKIDEVIKANKLVVAAVLSGNRNFEGRIHPSVRANYLASPPLCVAYAIAGNINIDLSKEPLGKDYQGNDVYLKDIWPTAAEIDDMIAKYVTPEIFSSKYSEVFLGDKAWQDIKTSDGMLYGWDDVSTYIKKAPYFEGMKLELPDIAEIKDAKILAIFGDSITTDHISPAGNIAKDGPAAKYLISCGVQPADFNSFGSRRGNHEVMMRGTFANIRIKNEIVGGMEGGYTKFNGEVMSIYDAAMLHQKSKTPLVIFAGKEYGTGSSRDWAAKGTNLLGVAAVIAESFERIHRSNLVGMRVVPFVFVNGMTRKDLNLAGDETISIDGLSNLQPGMIFKCSIAKSGELIKTFDVQCRVDTEIEVEYIKHGGVLNYVLRGLVQSSSKT